MNILDIGNLKPVFQMHERFHREEERLKTFHRWSSKFINYHDLALTGMFYSGVRDKTICYFCGVEIEGYTLFDTPLNKHLHRSLNCPLLLGYTMCNKPIDQAKLDFVVKEIKKKIANKHTVEIRKNAFPEGVIPKSKFIKSKIIRNLKENILFVVFFILVYFYYLVR